MADEQKVELVKVILTFPQGVPLGATSKEPPGWTVAKSDAAITWSAGGGAYVKPDHFEQWGFETDGADKPGTFTFKVTLGFADKTTTEVDVPIAAVVGSPTAVGGPTTLAAVPIAVKVGQGRANAGISVGVLALLLSIVALAILATRRRKSLDVTGRKAQDW